MATNSSPSPSSPHKSNKIILDIQDCVHELKEEYKECLIPINDDNQQLHRFCSKLEFLLRSDQKEKYSLLGTRKDYWDYFYKCLASTRTVHDGIKFIKSVSEFKTSLGRGRAFLRFCLMHQCLADTLQQCVQTGRITSDFYNEKSLLLNFESSSCLIASLYELNDVQFDLGPYGYDLDVAWPTFAHKTFGSRGLWRAPSRTVSMTSLSSIVSQQNEQVHGFSSFMSDERPDSRLYEEDEVGMDQTDSKNLVEKTQSQIEKNLNLLDSSAATSSEMWWRQEEARLQNRLTDLEQLVDEYTRRLDFVSNEKRELEERFCQREADLENTVKNLTSRTSELQLQVETLENATCQSCADYEIKLAEVKEIEKLNSNKAEALACERDYLLEQLEKWKQLVAGYTEKVAVKARVIEHLEKQVKAMKEATDALREITQLKTVECESLKKLVQELKVTSSPSNALTSSLVTKNSELEAKIVEISSEIVGLKNDLETKSKLLTEWEMNNAAAADKVDESSNIKTLEEQVSKLGENLKVSIEENLLLQSRLETMREWLQKVERAEVELELLEREDGVDEERLEPEGEASEELSAMAAENLESVPCDEDMPVILVVQKTVERLQRLITDKKELQEINNNLISRVHEQQEKLTTVTFELSETKRQVAQLTEAFNKLQTSEAVLRYELKEKRTVVDRLKEQLEFSRAQWSRIRQKHSESEQGVLSLRAEFASRHKQESEESGYIEERDDTEKTAASASFPVVCPSSTRFHHERPSFSESSSPDVVTPISEIGALGSTAPNCDEMECVETPASVNVIVPPPPLPSSDDGQPKSRLQLMEEQCQLLYSQLIASRNKSEFLEWKLAQIHDRHGGQSGTGTETDVTESEGGDEEGEEGRLPIRDVNANFDVVAVTDDDKLHDAFAENAELEADISIDDDVVIEELLACGAVSAEEVDGVISESLSRCEVVDNVSVNVSKALNDHHEPLSCQPRKGIGKRLRPEALAMAQALPKRVEKLKKVKEELERDIERLHEERSLSNICEKDLRTDLKQAQSRLAERESEVNVLASRMADLLQRETEFKKRVELIMRKEREEKESRYRIVMEAKRELQLKMETLEEQVNERQIKLDGLEVSLIKCREEFETTKVALEQEVKSLRFQLSSETLRREQAMKSHSRYEEDVANLRDRISEQEQLIANLEDELIEIRRDRELEKKQQKLEFEDLQLCLNTREDECTALNDELKETTRHLDSERKSNHQLKLVVEDTTTENQKMKSELIELRKDSLELQKKIIKLIREKDLLWKRSEHLSFQQKIQATDRWLKDEEATHCCSCKAEFTLVLRKHHCRLCGRIFCFNCCNHWAMTASSSRRVRVCNECIIRHSQIDTNSISLNESDDEGSSTTETSDSLPIPQSPHDDSAISGTPSSDCEGLHGIPAGCNSPIASDDTHEELMTRESDGRVSSPGGATQSDQKAAPREGSSLLGRLFTSWSSSPKSTGVSEGAASLNDEEFYVISDEEIMKSLSSSSPYWPLVVEGADPSIHLCPTMTVSEVIEEFNSGLPREVWVNAGKTYAVPILIDKKTTLTWVFNTEPKSIAFTLVFHVDSRSDETLERGIPSQVLIDTTHCDSHLHPVHGKLVAKKPGIYTFYFDNGFSRFTAKKVKFILCVHSDEESVGETSRQLDSQAVKP